MKIMVKSDFWVCNWFSMIERLEHYGRGIMNFQSLQSFKYKFNLLKNMDMKTDRKYINDLKLDVDRLFGDNWYPH